MFAKVFKTVLFAFFLLSLVLVSQIFRINADRGGFSPRGYTVFEGGQKALIAWNGTDEMLILSTDVKGSQETHVIEILPLPAEPTIEKGSENSFRQVQSLIRQFFAFYSFPLGPYTWDRSAGLGGREGTTQGVAIVFHDEIGAHSITVVKAVVTEELTSWIDDFLSALGIDYEESPAGLGNLISQYIEDEINYFVLDVIEVNSTVKSVEPLVYTFKTSKLYYPLKISSLFSGNTKISLCCLTREKLADASILEEGFKKVVRFRVKLKALSRINSAMPEMFSISPYLCFYEYKGSLSSFQKDVKIGFVPFFYFEPFFNVPPLLGALAVGLGASLIFLFVLTPSRKSLLDLAIALSVTTVVLVAVVLAFNFLVIWLISIPANVNFDVLLDVHLWIVFLMFESVIMMLVGGISHWDAFHWPRSRRFFTPRETRTDTYRTFPRLRHRWFWFSFTMAGFVLFIHFIYLLS